jgi:ribonuclease E
MASEPTTDTNDERSTDFAADTEATRGDASPSASEDTASAEPTSRKATRKRATTSRAKKAAPSRVPQPEHDSTAATDDALDDPDAADAAAAPAPAKRSRARRPKAASALAPPTAASEPTAQEAAEDDTGAGGASVEDAVGTADAEDPGLEGADLADAASVDSGEGDVEDGAGGRVPGFGLLFQAPEPVAPRRRRATSAAGAPAPVDDEHTDALAQEPGEARPGSSRRGRGRSAQRGDQSGATPGSGAGEDADRGEDTRDAQATDEDRAGEQADGSDESESGTRRSRRRGGRGRRPRGGDADEGDQDVAPEDGAVEQADADDGRKSSRRGRRGTTSDATGDGTDRRDPGPEAGASEADDGGADEGPSSRRRRRRRRNGPDGDTDEGRGARARDEVTGLKGSTRLEAKKQRRREGREAGRRRTVITEAEFLARRESVERVMVVRERDGKTQIAVLEDGVLVEHYVSRESGASMIGNVYLGRVQNVLPSMEAAFVDIGKGRNAVLYAGEVNWDAAGLEGNVPKRIENALSSGDTVLVQATKDPIGHKGARLTSQVSLPGRFLVYVPEASMTGISRKLPDTERARLKSILKKIVPDDAGVIVRTAAEGASEEELTADIARLTKAWERIQTKAEKAAKKKGSAGAPVLLHGEPDLTVKVIRDVFNEDFSSLVVAGERAWSDVSEYLEDVAPELAKRLTKWTSETDLFTHYRVDEQIAKALDRKVWLPSGGSLVIDRTEAMTVVDVNTGKFVGSGGNLEETVTKNNIEAAEEIVRQLRLRDIGGIIVVDFIDMVLEANRDLVVRRLLECLGRDRTKHQVAEVTSLGLVQMTRKRVGSGLLEVFSEPCAHCSGRGVVVHSDPLDDSAAEDDGNTGRGRGRGRGNGNGGNQVAGGGQSVGPRGGGRGNGESERPQPTGPTAAQIAAAAHAAALKANASAVLADAADAAVAEAAADVETALALEAASDATAPGIELSPVGDEAPVSDEAQVGDEAPVSDQAPVGDEAQVADPSDAPGSGDAADSTEASELPVPPSPSGPGEMAPGSAPEAAPPAVRPRRKRGRVVAQAGPPGQSEVRVIAAESTMPGSEGAEALG